MSIFLTDIVSNKISIEEGLQRLLVIANATNNTELIKWCSNELNGYNKFEGLPTYRKAICRDIRYTGINGAYKITDMPIGPGFLSESTLSQIEMVGVFDNIAKVEEYKDVKKMIYRDITYLACEIYDNTDKEMDGVKCTSIRQLIPSGVYSSVYSNVKTRVINLLCAFESAKVDIDKLDIAKGCVLAIKEKNSDIYKTVVDKGDYYTFVPKNKKIVWNVLIPILTSIVSGLVVYFISNICTK